MKKISSVVVASAIALSMLAFGGRIQQRQVPSFPPDMTVSNMTKAGRIVVSRPIRSVRRRLRGWPRSATAVRSKMTERWNGETRGRHRVAPTFASPAW